MTLDEQLSALLAGDLPEDEATVLRQRIADEPEVAAAWASMQALAADLDELPDEMTPPALRQRRFTPKPRTWAAMGAIAVAAVLLLLIRGVSPRAELVLSDGTQWVEGRSTVLAGDVLVDVDGAALISVEPSSAPVRATGQEDPKMMKSAVLGAAAGAVVTVAVYEGTALLVGAGGEAPVTVSAGETHQVGVPTATTRKRMTVPVPSVPTEGMTEEQATIAQLQAELDAVRTELEQAKFTKALTQGQLAAHVGDPSPWPDQPPEGLGQEQFRDLVAGTLDAYPELALAEIDCNEFPCVAILDLVDPVNDGLKERLDSLSGHFESAVDDGTGVMIGVAINDGEGDGGGGVVGITMLPEDANPDVRDRTDYRFRTLMKDYEGAATDVDHDIE